MNTMTVVEPTLIGAEEDAVSQHGGPTVRVTIREIREYAYRALIAAGASAGEAATAAGQVLHAELHAGEGLADLVSDLARGPWSRSGLICTRRPGGRPVLEVDCGGRSGELRVGAPIVELVAGEAEPAVAVTTADVPVTALLDEALLTAAVGAGTSVTAMRVSSDRAYVVRLATSDGDLAHGALSAADLPLLPGVDGTDETQALVVVTGADVGAAHVRLAWSTRDSRAERRRQAALHGIQVDQVTWRVVAEHAQRFLVPEDDS
jgi:hypothetical protein